MRAGAAGRWRARRSARRRRGAPAPGCGPRLLPGGPGGHIRRIGWVAELLARNGVLVLVSAIAPYRDVREQVRSAHAANGTAYLEVHVSTPVEVAADRDVKGLYARQRQGEISGLTGVDDPYEAPIAPDLVIPAHQQPVADSVALLLDHLATRGLVGVPRADPHFPKEYA